jgi:hypothetical protein
MFPVTSMSEQAFVMPLSYCLSLIRKHTVYCTWKIILQIFWSQWMNLALLLLHESAIRRRLAYLSRLQLSQLSYFGKRVSLRIWGQRQDDRPLDVFIVDIMINNCYPTGSFCFLSVNKRSHHILDSGRCLATPSEIKHELMFVFENTCHVFVYV